MGKRLLWSIDKADFDSFDSLSFIFVMAFDKLLFAYSIVMRFIWYMYLQFINITPIASLMLRTNFTCVAVNHLHNYSERIWPSKTLGCFSTWLLVWNIKQVRYFQFRSIGWIRSLQTEDDWPVRIRVKNTSSALPPPSPLRDVKGD
jgi:hypothetical protein